MPENEYYQENREHLIKSAREYYYKHRDRYLVYQKEYYLKNKEKLNERRRAKMGNQQSPPRPRANLTKPNKKDELEERRKAFEAVQLSPPEPPKAPVVVWIPNFTVSFD